MIKLDDYYTIESDASCWSLLYEKQGDINPNTGKPIVSRDASYHANLKQALHKYLDNCLKQPESVQGLMVRLAQVEATINKLGGTAQ